MEEKHFIIFFYKNKADIHNLVKKKKADIHNCANYKVIKLMTHVLQTNEKE